MNWNKLDKKPLTDQVIIADSKGRVEMGAYFANADIFESIYYRDPEDLIIAWMSLPEFPDNLLKEWESANVGV